MLNIQIIIKKLINKLGPKIKVLLDYSELGKEKVIKDKILRVTKIKTNYYLLVKVRYQTYSCYY